MPVAYLTNLINQELRINIDEYYQHNYGNLFHAVWSFYWWESYTQQKRTGPSIEPYGTLHVKVQYDEHL